MARFNGGCVWWLDTAEFVQMASEEQTERYEGDPWEEAIGPGGDDRPSVSISEVLEKCLQKPQGHRDCGLRPIKTVLHGACTGLGALPRTPGIAFGMAIQKERRLVVPGVFPQCCYSVPTSRCRKQCSCRSVLGVPVHCSHMRARG
ncbi:MAG TPA: hypothetical protein VFC10_06455 [Terriglobia bacterium]|nr:hypothetical protein [Terriglobia bacterium]